MILHTEATTISGGYQICEGCGQVMVNGDRALYRPTGLDRETRLGGYVHTGTSQITNLPCTEMAISYLAFKEHVERETFPGSSAEIYGDAR